MADNDANGTQDAAPNELNRVLVRKKAGTPYAVYVPQGPRQDILCKAVTLLGGLPRTRSVQDASFALVEPEASNYNSIYWYIRDANEDCKIVNQKWIFRCKETRMLVKSAPFMPDVPRRSSSYKDTKTPFTPGDQMTMAKYLYRANRHQRGAMSLKTYTVMLEKMPHFGHTAESCKEHYKRNKGRIDELVAVYKAQVQKRRDWGKDPYSDAEEGPIDRYYGKDGAIANDDDTSGAGSPEEVAPRPSRKGKEREVIPPSKRPALAIGPAQGPARSKAAFRSEAISLSSSPPIVRKAIPAARLASELAIKVPASSNGSKRRRDSTADHLADEAPVAPVQSTSRPASYPTPISPDQVRPRPASVKAGPAIPFVAFDEDEEEEEPVRIQGTRGRDRPIVPVQDCLTSSPDVQERLLDGTSQAALTSRELPAALLADRPWSSLHLDTILTQKQLDDLIHILSGSQEAALDFAHILTAQRFGNLDEGQKRRLKEIRKMIWTPEDDAAVLAEVGRNAVPRQVLEKHGYEVYKARIVYLAEYAEEHGHAELDRPRFPFV